MEALDVPAPENTTPPHPDDHIVHYLIRIGQITNPCMVCGLHLTYTGPFTDVDLIALSLRYKLEYHMWFADGYHKHVTGLLVSDELARRRQ